MSERSSADHDDIAGSAVPRRVTGAVAAEVDDDLILLSPRDFSYFGATGPGPIIWSLVDGQHSVDAMVDHLRLQFEGSLDEIRSDVVDFVGALVAAGLAEI